ncbi:MAG TPA: hypothetical protein PLE19_04625 [Planctomycetota bacterium]|nr:hypothetical protein [Planctomycetota bacterium]HRR79072.1 hypothetical protein [Planctomycetota bacterium]HRT93022.1 hypothetical protein [Planctomycetota bacterium]
MANVEFETLAALLEREGALSGDRALPLLREATRTLSDAHAAAILHCDLRPGTLLVAGDGRVLLAESALSRRLGEPRQPDTPATERIASPLYYPPEAAQGLPLDARTDLFLLGATFYHAMTGAPPFDGEDPEARALQYIRHDVPPLEERVPGTPVLLNVLMQKLLRRNPDERYQSAADLLDAVERTERMLQKRQEARRAPASAGAASTDTPRHGKRPRARQGTAAAEAQAERHPTTRRAAAKAPLWQSKPILYGGAAAALALVVLVALLSRGGSKPQATKPPAALSTASAVAPPSTPAATARKEPPKPVVEPPKPKPKPKTSTPAPPREEYTPPKPQDPPEVTPRRWKAVQGAAAGTETYEEFLKRTKGIEVVDYEDYVVNWEYAGPYHDPACAEKCGPFDNEFPPEKPGETPTWAPMPKGTDAGRPWLFNFRQITEIAQVASERAAIYLRTRVYSALERDVQIWAGSDDSIKIWLNGRIVHSNRRDRAVRPDEDKLDVKLKQGWNDLMVKIGQGNGEWGFCLRFRTRDGGKVEELRADPAGK